MNQTMTETMLPTYNARIRFKTCVPVNAHTASPWFAGAEMIVQKRVMTDQIIRWLADNRALGGRRFVQWQAVYDSLRRGYPSQWIR